MATRFRLYSTDVAATLNPDALGHETPTPITTAPATLIKWDHDPIKSQGLQITPPARRGQAIRTGTGVVYHDHGVVEGDGTLTVTGNTDDGEWLAAATVASLQTAYETANAQWYFTDGLDCWKVRFQSMNTWRHQLWAEHGITNYSYEITFYIVETVL
jgi:hypothetical protein